MTSESPFRNPLTEHDLSVEQLIALGPIQPRNSDKKGTNILVSGRIKCLRFQDTWYAGRPWLEYSMAEDTACCFYCRTFLPQLKGKYCRPYILMSQNKVDNSRNRIWITVAYLQRVTTLRYTQIYCIYSHSFSTKYVQTEVS